MVMPVLCNRTDAPCIKVCPGNPKTGPGQPCKAMYKTPGRHHAAHNPNCAWAAATAVEKCPYSHEKLDARASTAAYSVISLNAMDEEPQPYWAGQDLGHPGLHVLGTGTAAKADCPVPAMSAWKGSDRSRCARDDVVEKCTFCYHRAHGLQPACVEVCLAGTHLR